MLTLVNIPASVRASADASSLIADYVAFDRRRTLRRQYMKAFGGMAIVIFFGALFRYVPRREAVVVDGLLLVPPAVLAAIELFHWHRLNQKLNRERIQAQTIRKS
jgi:hypothetical protein